MSYAAYAELCLVNDLFSWEKEYASHLKNNGEVPLINAVHIVAVTQGLTHCAAKAVVQAEIRAHEERFVLLKEQYEATSNPSDSVLRWLKLLEHSMAGNWVWSLCTPRYFKIDRNPYKDHLEKYGSDAVQVLTIPEQLRNSKQEAKDTPQSAIKDTISSTYKPCPSWDTYSEHIELTIFEKQTWRATFWLSTLLGIPQLTRQVSTKRLLKAWGPKC